MTASFALISFNSLAAYATIASTNAAFHRVDNTAADQQRDVTSTSVVGYLLLGGAGGLAGLAGYQRGNRVSVPMLLLLLAYLALCYTSLLWSADRSLTIRKLVVLTLFLSAAVGFVQWLGLRGFTIACGVCAAATLAIGLLAEVRISLFRPWQGDYRFSGVVHPNETSIIAAVLCMTIVFLVLPAGQRRTLAMLVLAGAAVLLILTKSRTGLAACVVALSIGLLVRAQASTKALLAGGAIAAAGALILFVASTGAAGVFDVASLGRGEHVSSLTGRVPLWNLLLGEAADRPFVGYGYGAFWSARNIDDISREFYWHIPQGHSIYIDLILNLGVVGLLAFLAVMAAGLATAVARYSATGQAHYLFAASAVILAAVHGIAESKFFATGFPGLMLFGCFAGLALGPGEAAAANAATSAEPLRFRPAAASRRLAGGAVAGG
ncbi:MAG: O-antigen ligase family protein [Planctomycetota bacterium]